MNRDEKLAEFVGALIGDGYISYSRGKFKIGFTGHPLRDKEYFLYLKSLIYDLWGKEVRIVNRLRGLRIGFRSKSAIDELLSIGLPVGEKSGTITIPEFIIRNPDLLTCTIRGIVDTDGSVFTSKKPGVRFYPSIEITTSSYRLALQLKSSLNAYGFRIPKIRGHRSKLSTMVSYKVALYGFMNLERYLNVIGFSNPYKKIKAQKIEMGRMGFSEDRISFEPMTTRSSAD